MTYPSSHVHLSTLRSLESTRPTTTFPYHTTTMTTSLRSACSSLFGSLRTLTPIPSGPSSSRWASSYVQLHDLMPNPGSTRNVRPSSISVITR